MIRELKDLGVQDLGSGLFGKGVLNLPNIEVYEADTYKKRQIQIPEEVAANSAKNL